MRLEASVRFDPLTHRYWLGARELFAVTRILRDAGLVDATWWSETARLRGSALHRATEALDRDEPLPPLDASSAPYLQAYDDFRHDVHPVWHGIETPVADPCLGYAGRPDRWGSCQGEPVVVDLKTGAVPGWAPLQLVAYARLALDAAGSCRRRRLVVHLLPTGRYALREYPVVNFGRDERVFLAALAVTQWKAAA